MLVTYIKFYSNVELQNKNVKVTKRKPLSKLFLVVFNYLINILENSVKLNKYWQHCILNINPNFTLDSNLISFLIFSVFKRLIVQNDK